MIEFRFEFNQNLFSGVQLTISQQWSRRQAITWTNADLVHWRIYAAQGGDALTKLLTHTAFNLPLLMKRCWEPFILDSIENAYVDESILLQVMAWCQQTTSPPVSVCRYRCASIWLGQSSLHYDNNFLKLNLEFQSRIEIFLLAWVPGCRVPRLSGVNSQGIQ